MNYAANYDRLIARARGRVLNSYRERHHVIPRCMAGTDDPSNIVDLTPEEHYVAHQLLVKMYPGDRLLAHAAMMMAARCTGNKAFGWLRRRHAKAIALVMRKPKSRETRARIAAAHRGKPKSAAHRASMSAARLGKPKGPHAPETLAKLSASMRGKSRAPFSSAWRENLSLALRGNKNRVGIPHTPEVRAKIAAAHLGKKMSPEAIEKAAASHRGKKRSVETRARMSAASCIRWARAAAA